MHGSKPLDKALRALAKALSKCGARNNFQGKFHFGGGGEGDKGCIQFPISLSNKTFCFGKLFNI